jgi:hypothetical protein
MIIIITTIIINIIIINYIYNIDIPDLPTTRFNIVVSLTPCLYLTPSYHCLSPAFQRGSKKFPSACHDAHAPQKR